MAKYSITAILGVDSSRMAAGLKGAGKKLGAWAKSADQKIRAGVSTGLKYAGVAVAAFVTMSVREFGKFEKQMNEVFTLLPGITEKAMEEMSASTLEFAEKLGMIPEEVVPALYQSLSAGVPKENVFTFMEVAAKAAIGGVTDIETAVDGLTTVINSYGKSNMDAKRAADLMFTTVKLGKTTMEELSASLYNVLPVASNAGVGFEQVSAALATLTSRGVPTAQATTQLRQAILSLQAPSVRARKQLEGMGVDVDGLKETLAKEPDGLIKAMEILMEATDGDAEAMKKLLGSVESYQAVVGLTAGESKQFTSALKEMGNAAGAADAAFDAMDKGFSRSMDRMKSTLKVSMIKFGKALMPLFERLAPLLNKLTKMIQAIDWDKLVSGFIVMMEKWRPLWDELVAGVKAMPWADLAEQGKIFFTVLATAIHQSVKLIIKVLPAVIPIIKAVMGYYQMLIARITIIATVLAELADPIVKFVSQVMNAISAFFNLITNPSPEQFEKFIKAFLGSFEQLGKSIIGLFKQIGSMIGNVIKSWFYGIDAEGAAGALADGAIGGVTKAIRGSKDMILGVIDGLIQSVKDMFSSWAGKAAGGFKSKLGETLMDSLGIIKRIVGNVMGIFEELFGIFGEVAGEFQGKLTGAGDGVMSWLKMFVDKLAAAYAKFYQMYLTVYEAITKTLLDLVKWAKPLIKDLMRAYMNVVGAAMTAIKELAEPILDLFYDIVDFIQTKFMAIVERIAPVIKAALFVILKAYTFVYNLIAAYILAYVEIIKGVIKSIKAFVMPALDAIIDVVLHLWDKIIEAGKAAIKIISEAFGSAEGKSMSMKEIFQKQIIPAIRSVMEWVEKVFKKAGEGWQLLKPHLIWLIDFLSAVLGPVLKLLLRLVITIFKTLWPLLEGVVKAVARVIHAVYSIIKPVVILIKELIEGVLETIGALWEIFMGILTGDFVRIQAGFETIGEALMDIVKAIWGVIKGVVTAIVDIVIGAWDLIWGILKGAWELIKGLFTALYDFIYDILIGNSVTSVFKDCFDFVLGIIKGVFKIIMSILETFFDFFVEGLKVIRDIVVAVFGVIGDVISGVIGVVSDIIGGFFDMFTKGLEIIEGIVKAVFGVIGAVAGAVFGVLKAGWKAVGAVAGAVWSGIKGAASAAWKGIKGIASAGQAVLKKGWETAKGVAKGIWSGIKGIVGGAWDGIKSIASKGVDALNKGWETAKGAASSAWKGIKGAAGGAWSWIKKTAGAGVDTLKRGWESAKGAAKNSWESVKGYASGAVDKMKGWYNSLKATGTSMWEKLKGSASKAWAAAKEGAKSAAESAGLIEPEANKGTKAIEKQKTAAEKAAQAIKKEAKMAYRLRKELQWAEEMQLLLNEAARQYELLGNGMTPGEQILEAIERQKELNELAKEHPFVKMANAPELTLKVGNHLKPVTKHLKSIDDTLKRIDKTVAGKFVNQ